MAHSASHCSSTSRFVRDRRGRARIGQGCLPSGPEPESSETTVGELTQLLLPFASGLFTETPERSER